MRKMQIQDESNPFYHKLYRRKERKDKERRYHYHSNPQHIQHRTIQFKKISLATKSILHTKSIQCCREMMSGFDGDDLHYPRVEVFGAKGNGIEVLADRVVHKQWTSVVKIGVCKESVVQMYHLESDLKLKREVFLILFSKVVVYPYEEFGLRDLSPKVWKERMQRMYKIDWIRNDKEDWDDVDGIDVEDPLRDLEELDWDVHILTFQSKNFVQTEKLDRTKARNLLENYMQNKNLT
eukprot:TRINITY_DN11219_c0_g1_i1.p1 TRINITY_DN11219_c0_g1~~TRINITY_DN11219_c0_g1_i1.p1  ORF type:complete len:237 (-),score=84.16 TRINITY_DN11219_c0_g1_i1:20-730(-)